MNMEVVYRLIFSACLTGLAYVVQLELAWMTAAALLAIGLWRDELPGLGWGGGIIAVSLLSLS